MFRFLCILLFSHLVFASVPSDRYDIGKRTNKNDGWYYDEGIEDLYDDENEDEGEDEPRSNLREDFSDEEIDWGDVDDDLLEVIGDYDEEALVGSQENIDARLQTAIFTKASKGGYPLEAHTVTTEDGYILTVHRIPYGRLGNKPNTQVVFLQHGLLSSAYDWTTQGPGKALAFLLADRGYDVWLGNARGNSYSKNHIKYKTRSKDFWNFSWNEIGYYDLPAMIDYVLRNTGQESLNYVGHSQGTTSFFVMASTRPEYNRKIKAFHALAPVAFMSNLFNPFFQFLAPLVSKVGLMRKLIGSMEFLPSTKLIRLVGSVACKDSSLVQGFCTNGLFMIAGFSKDNMNATLLPEIAQTSPAGCSFNQIVHYAQEIVSKKFRKYDFGITKNLLKYLSISPPDYDLKKVSAPVHLYYANNDWLAAVKDVQILASKLPNVVFNKEVPYKSFNHLDFLWGLNAIEMVYNDLIENIERYS